MRTSMRARLQLDFRDLCVEPASVTSKSAEVGTATADGVSRDGANGMSRDETSDSLQGAQILQIRATSPGLLNAVVFWFNLSVSAGSDPCTSVSSAPPEVGSRGGAPGGWSEGWRQAACYLATPQYVRAGDLMTLRVTIAATRVHFEVTSVRMPSKQSANGAGPAVGTATDAAAAADGTRTASAASDTSTDDRRVAVSAPSNLPKSLHPAAAIHINAYHFCMVADTSRNTAFRAVIERAVRARPGCRVLDIGAGTGLLGVIAARSGASRVDCVEMNDLLQVTARKTLAASGVAQSSVWHAISTELQIDPTGEKGPSAKADLIVSEILDSGLIGEGVLHTMRDATSRLLAPGGTVLPAAATVYAMAVELRPPEFGDFDLGALEQLRKGCFYSSLRVHTVGHVKLSAPAVAFRFDFASPGELDGDGAPIDQEVRLQLPVIKTGRCNAILWWFDLHLDAETTLCAGPGASVRTWKQNVAHIEPCVSVKKGEVIEALLWTSREDQIHVAGGKPPVKRPAVLASSNTLEPSFVLRDVSTWVT